MTRKTTFFERWSWFKFNNLRLALDMSLKFYTSVGKGLKLKLKKFCGLSPAFVEPPTLNRVKNIFFYGTPPVAASLATSGCFFGCCFFGHLLWPPPMVASSCCFCGFLYLWWLLLCFLYFSWRKLLINDRGYPATSTQF